MKKIYTKKGEEILVDDQDYDRVKKYTWFCDRYGKSAYAATSIKMKNGKRRKIRMHRLIMNPPAGMDVDHINGNGLDNRRANLRICTHQQNCSNRTVCNPGKSGYRGVYLAGRYWEARIRNNMTRTHIGMFTTAKDAALAFDQYLLDTRGEFASKLNFPNATQKQRKEALARRRCGSSKHKGVSRIKNTSKWRVVITVNEKLKHFGSFATEKEAAAVAEKQIKLREKPENKIAKTA